MSLTPFTLTKFIAIRALGQQAYCTVVQALLRENQRFRVLALSATPGDNIEAVQQVLNNLVTIQLSLISYSHVIACFTYRAEKRRLA